jgi:starvation-inducible DNA-binding protein
MEQLIQQLKVILGTNFALYLKSHNFHWNIEGPNFPQYHGFLDSFYNSVWEQNDDIAEHIRQLDSYAPGSFTRFLELSAIEEELNIPQALEMMSILKDDNDKFIIQLRAGIVVAEQANEPAVGNFLQDLLAAHQKHAWMLRSIIK